MGMTKKRGLGELRGRGAEGLHELLADTFFVLAGANGGLKKGLLLDALHGAKHKVGGLDRIVHLEFTGGDSLLQ